MDSITSADNKHGVAVSLLGLPLHSWVAVCSYAAKIKVLLLCIFKEFTIYWDYMSVPVVLMTWKINN